MKNILITCPFTITPAVFGQVDKSSLFDNAREIEKKLIENKVPALGIGVINNGKVQQVKVFGELKKEWRHRTIRYYTWLF